MTNHNICLFELGDINILTLEYLGSLSKKMESRYGHLEIH